MSFRAFSPKSNKVYALSVGATQTATKNPAGFVHGGNQARISNSGATDVLIAFWSGATPATLTFPADGDTDGQYAGLPQGLATATLVLHGTEKQISIPLTATSFAAIGSAAGPSLVYVQRGDGSV